MPWPKSAGPYRKEARLAGQCSAGTKAGSRRRWLAEAVAVDVGLVPSSPGPQRRLLGPTFPTSSSPRHAPRHLPMVFQLSRRCSRTCSGPKSVVDSAAWLSSTSLSCPEGTAVRRGQLSGGDSCPEGTAVRRGQLSGGEGAAQARECLRTSRELLRSVSRLVSLDNPSYIGSSRRDYGRRT